MNMNVFEQRFNEEFQKELESRDFKPSGLTNDWLYYAHLALHHASPMSLGVSAKEFIALKELFTLTCTGMKATAQITLYQFALLNNNLEARTPDQLTLSLDDYCDLMLTSNELAAEWKELTTPIRDELEKKLAAEFAEANKGLGRPAGFKPVKAEA